MTIKFEKSDALENLFATMGDDPDEGEKVLKKFVATLPHEKVIFISPNDWEDGVGFAMSAVNGLVSMLNSLSPGEQIFKADLEFGADIDPRQGSTIILAGDEVTLETLLKTMLS